MRNDEFVVGVPYREALANEAEWRSKPDNAHDVALFDEMLGKINVVGYDSCRCYPDIRFASKSPK